MNVTQGGDKDEPAGGSWQAAFGVHLFTAIGAALAMLAAIAAGRGAYTPAFLALGVATIIDGIDGPLARRMKVAHRLPRWDGNILDFVIDYTTYVFVPAIILAGLHLVRAPFDILLAVVIAVVGALYFADRGMKTADNGFRGFPAAWNMAIFTLAVVRPPEWASAAMLLALGVLTFVPMHFVHPVRVVRWRPLTLGVTLLWATSAVASLAWSLDPPAIVAWLLVAASAYLFLVGLVIQLSHRARVAEGEGRPFRS